MRWTFAGALSLLLLAACSGGADDTDSGTMSDALNEIIADGSTAAPPGGDPAGSDGAAALDVGDNAGSGRSTEKLREGLPIGMGSAFFMCQRTLSIVGENCGCMVNRATDAGIADARQARMFGGRQGNASNAEVAAFRSIVNACSGYNVTVSAEAPEPQPEIAPEPDIASAAPRRSQPQVSGRRVGCYFGNSVYEYDGACEFVLGPGGDFTTTSLEGPYFENVTRIGLDVTGKGVGNLAITYPGGYVQQTPVRRSTTDKSCWEGPRLTFCVR
jgi:hypothetical protein